MLDHTADVGFELGASTLEGLFDEARRALLMVVFERPPEEGKDGREVLLSAPDVIEATHGVGIGHEVARLRSLIVVKG